MDLFDSYCQNICDFGVILKVMREKIHKKYIQIIGHHKRKVFGVFIVGILGMLFLIFYYWHLKTQYDLSQIVPSSNTQVDTNSENEIDTTREGFVKGDSVKQRWTEKGFVKIEEWTLMVCQKKLNKTLG